MNLKCFLILFVGYSSSVFSVTIEKCPNWMCMNLILAQFFKLKKKKKKKSFYLTMGTYIPSFSTSKKKNHKFSCIVNFRLFHMHCIKTAISILMYRFCKYYTMYVRLNCICSVYVIYLCPINVLILSDTTSSFLNWRSRSSCGPFLAGRWCCCESPEFNSGCFWLGMILRYSWSVCRCGSAVYGIIFS